MANLQTDLSNKGSDASADYKNKILGSNHKTDSFANTIGEKFQSMAPNFSKSSAKNMQTSREYVKSNPVKSVAYAAAAGIATGYLLSLAMRRGSKA